MAVEPKEVRLEGPKGKLRTTIPPGVNVKVEGPIVRVEREGEQRHLRALHGLTRKLIAKRLKAFIRPMAIVRSASCFSLKMARAAA